MADLDFGLVLLDGVAETDEEQETKQNDDDIDDNDGVASGRLVQFDLPGEEEDGGELGNDFSLSDIRDDVVSFRTNQHYVRDCFHFLEYCHI